MSKPIPLQGEILPDDQPLTLEQLCRRCALPEDQVLLLVEEGIIEPLHQPGQTTTEHWHFHWRSISRVRTSARLQQDLGVNLAGVGLAMELLDRISQLERQLQTLSSDELAD